MEEENKKKKNGGLIATVIILAVLVLGLGGYITYDKLTEEKCPTNTSVESNKNKRTENVDEGTNITAEDIKNANANVASVDIETSNDYKKFADNLKTQYTNYTFTRYDVVEGPSDIGQYAISLTDKGELYIEYLDEELAKKYGKVKIAEKVIDYSIIAEGSNSGHYFTYFIYENGTVALAFTDRIEGEKIVDVLDLPGYKNIVSIRNGHFANSNYFPIFIDIDGNVIYSGTGK